MQSLMIESNANIEEAAPAVARLGAAWFVMAGLLVLGVVISRLGMIGFPFFNDSGLYVLMGRTVARGGVLYRDFYETKLPGVGLIASVFWRAFGTWWPGYVVGQLGLTFLAAAALGRAARRHLNADSFWPTFLFAVIYLNLSWIVFTGFQLETLQAFFAALSGAAALEALASDSTGDFFTAGLTAGCAAMVKPTGLAPAIALGLVLLLNRRNLRHLLAVIAGIAVPTGVTAIYVWRTGIGSYLPGVVRQIQLYSSSTPITGKSVFIKLLIAAAVLGYPMAIRAFGPQSRSMSGKSPKRFSAFIVLWLLAEFAGVVLQRRMYSYHFLPLACPAALLYGMLPRRSQAASIAVSFLPLVVLSLCWDGSDLGAIPRGMSPSAITRYLSARTVVGDSIFGDRVAGELIATGLQPGSRFGIFYYWVNYDAAALDYWRGMHADLEQRRPKYVLVPSDADAAFERMMHGPILGVSPVRRENCQICWGEFREYLAGHYQREVSIEGEDIYRRRAEEIGSSR